MSARVEKVAHGACFRAIWPHRAVVPVDNWFEWFKVGLAVGSSRNQGPALIAPAQ